jgi:hypothetical protein
VGAYQSNLSKIGMSNLSKSQLNASETPKRGKKEPKTALKAESIPSGILNSISSSQAFYTLDIKKRSKASLKPTEMLVKIVPFCHDYLAPRLLTGGR